MDVGTAVLKAFSAEVNLGSLLTELAKMLNSDARMSAPLVRALSTYVAAAVGTASKALEITVGISVAVAMLS